MASSNLSTKSESILSAIAQGYSYDRIVSEMRLTYLDIFHAAQEALNLIKATKTPIAPSQVDETSIIDNSDENDRKYGRTYDNWNYEEEAILMSLVDSGRTLKEIAVELRRRPSAIRSRMTKIGLALSDQIPKPEIIGNRGARWTEEEKLLVTEYYANRSMTEIAHKLRRTTGGIRARIQSIRNEQAVGDRKPGKKRLLGTHPKNGQSIEIISGPYGPYFRCGDAIRGLPSEINPAYITIDHALKFLDAPPTTSDNSLSEQLRLEKRI